MSGVRVYRGYSSQYGAGLGNVLGGLIRSAVPFFTPLIKSAGKHLLTKGLSAGHKLLDTGASRLTDRFLAPAAAAAAASSASPRRNAQLYAAPPPPQKRRKKPVKRRGTTLAGPVRKKKRTKRDIFTT